MISCLIFSACQQSISETKTQNVKPLPTASIAPTNSKSSSPAATPNASKIRNFNGKGVVTKINLELVSVELDHEEIKGLMPKMQMEFYAKEKSELEVLKIGDKVDFVLDDNAGSEVIIKIKKSK